MHINDESYMINGRRIFLLTALGLAFRIYGTASLINVFRGPGTCVYTHTRTQARTRAEEAPKLSYSPADA